MAARFVAGASAAPSLDLEQNPFFVLELPADAGAVDVERQGKRLLAELELGRAAARSYPSPFGRCDRDEAAVRAAMAALRDPRLRAVYARFVPPRESWAAVDDQPRVERVDDEARRGKYPELLPVAPKRPSWLRRLLAGDDVIDVPAASAASPGPSRGPR